MIAIVISGFAHNDWIFGVSQETFSRFRFRFRFRSLFLVDIFIDELQQTSKYILVRWMDRFLLLNTIYPTTYPFTYSHKQTHSERHTLCSPSLSYILYLHTLTIIIKDAKIAHKYTVHHNPSVVVSDTDNS